MLPIFHFLPYYSSVDYDERPANLANSAVLRYLEEEEQQKRNGQQPGGGKWQTFFLLFFMYEKCSNVLSRIMSFAPIFVYFMFVVLRSIGFLLCMWTTDSTMNWVHKLIWKDRVNTRGLFRTLKYFILTVLLFILRHTRVAPLLQPTSHFHSYKTTIRSRSRKEWLKQKRSSITENKKKPWRQLWLNGRENVS